MELTDPGITEPMSSYFNDIHLFVTIFYEIKN